MRKNDNKTKKELISEVEVLRRDIAELRGSKSDPRIPVGEDNGEYGQLISIFDSIDEGIYVADPNNYEILYVNQAIKKWVGDVTGQKCYESLQGLVQKCDFCTNEKIFGENLGKTYIWEFQNKVTNRWFHCIDRAIKWPDGRMVRYEMAIDVNDRKLVEEELKESHKQLRNLALHLQNVREEERGRIARDIHDELGQVLTVIKFDADFVSKKLNEDQNLLRERTEVIAEISDKAIQTVKKIATELRPALLDDLGIAAAMEWQAGEFQRTTGIECDLVFGSWNALVDKEIATTIFRIFQEALTNVTRHSGATSVNAVLKMDTDSVILEVVDNGKGITEKEASKVGSFGLIGMEERIYPWDGQLTVSGVRGEGTTVKVLIPFTRKNEKEIL